MKPAHKGVIGVSYLDSNSKVDTSSKSGTQTKSMTIGKKEDPSDLPIGKSLDMKDESNFKDDSFADLNKEEQASTMKNSRKKKKKKRQNKIISDEEPEKSSSVKEVKQHSELLKKKIVDSQSDSEHQAEIKPKNKTSRS